MKKNKENSKHLFDLVSEISDKADQLLHFPDDGVKNAAEKIRENNNRINKAIRGLVIMLTMAYFALSCAGLAVIFLYKSNRQIKLLNKELIDKSEPTPTDSLKNKLLKSPSGGINYLADKKGNVISYPELIKQKDSLQDRLNDREFLLNYAIESYGLKFNTLKQGNKEIISVSSSEVNRLRKMLDQHVSYEKEVDKAVRKLPLHDSAKVKR